MKKGCLSGVVLFFGSILMIFFLFSGQNSSESNPTGASGNWAFTGEYTEELPLFSDVKGTGQISDEVAQLAVGTAVKYRLLPSVILSQWAYESTWGTSSVAVNDTNFFGITWFTNCPFPRGSARGIGGSEGGYYMQFPSAMASFSYYGFMVSTQANFNACVENRSPSECLLILGRGGYAAAGITETSPYYQACMGIISSNNLVQYDEYAIAKWHSLPTMDNTNPTGGSGNLAILQAKIGVSLYNGECYGLTAYYVDQLGGPKLMGSGFSRASHIGTDYNWAAFGWGVKENPNFSDIQPGDIVNFRAGNGFSTAYGHTGVAISATNGSVTVYDQWAGHGVTTSTYSRPVQSIVRRNG
ncbi:glucosaminidase domain-containing protein [Enterococcus sp. LJL90]